MGFLDRKVWAGLVCVLGLVVSCCVAARGQSGGGGVSGGSGEHEKKGAAALEAVRGNPLDLREFLKGMPKGADLHNHLSGAVYAESFIRVAAEEHMCVSLDTLVVTPGTAATGGLEAKPECGDGKVPAGTALRDQHLYDALVDAFSMRSFVPSTGITAHDHFFAAFAKFDKVYDAHLGDWIDEAATRAAAQNEQYLELMHTPGSAHSVALGKEIGWHGDFGKVREALLAGGLDEDVAASKKSLDEAEALRKKRERCGEKDAAAACGVEVRYLCQILRGFPMERVFAQTLECFEIAASDPRYVGINMVMPEDGYIARTDYALHMKMIGFMHEVYPKVHISLHAGEIAPYEVPYEDLCCHIRLAVEVGHAERIGHGAEVMYEDRPYELLKEMAAKHVMTEINLTSNDVILGVSGKEHPLPIYRKYHVPVALSSDDEGVSRIDLTHEYVRAVQTYGFKYGELKAMVRTGVEHAFLPGQSLWVEADEFGRVQAACAGDLLGAEKPSGRCGEFLKGSEKARQQWELERRFGVFERKF
jgi:adenosine deaminase